MTAPRTRSSTLLVALAALVGACGDDRGGRIPPARDVVLVTLDTLRHDRTSIGGYEPARTATLDRLADDGVVFERTYAPVPITLPSHASLLTGRSPLVHGLRMNGTTALEGSIPTAAETFQAAGYRTAAFVSSMVLEPRFGLGRGFEVYSAPPAGETERSGPDTVARAIEWLLDQPAEDRVFLWVHLYDPHTPYARTYDGDVTIADRATGVLLDALDDRGRYDDAMIVATSDHGEGLMDHGEEEHGIFLYEEVLRVPMVVKLPHGKRGGSRVTELVRLIDVAPTLLARAGLPPLAETEGVDLTPWMDGTPPRALSAYAETFVPREVHGFAPLFARVEGDLKFIDAPRAELYDLVEDPDESRNRLEQRGADATRLAAALEQHRKRLAGKRREGRQVTLDAEAAAALAELGYLEGTGGGDGALDPKDGIQVHNLIRRAIGASRPDEAVRLIEQARRIDPKNRAAAMHHARILTGMQRGDEGRALLEAFLRTDHRFFEGWMLLGSLYDGVAAHQSMRSFERARRLQPRNFEAAFNLARATELSGDTVAAEAAYEETLNVAREPRALNALAWLLATALPPTRDPTRALPLAEEAVAAEPTNAEFLDTLAEARFVSGDVAGAVAAMRDAIANSRTVRPDFQERLARFELLDQ